MWLRILFTNEFRLHKFYRYAKTFSILKYNFRSIHFFVNQIAMFVYETCERRCLLIPGRRVRDFWLCEIKESLKQQDTTERLQTLMLGSCSACLGSSKIDS